MAKKIDNDLLYVTNSLLRIDVMYLLESAGFARNYEIAEMLCRKSTILKRRSDYAKKLEVLFLMGLPRCC